MERLVNIFKALSDQTRLRIVWLLSTAGSELCVCEIMDSLDESQYNVSRHLKVLKYAGLVRDRKEGKWTFYSLKRPAGRSHGLLLEAILALPDELFLSESERLRKRLSLRDNGKCVIGGNSPEWNRALRELRRERC